MVRLPRSALKLRHFAVALALACLTFVLGGCEEDEYAVIVTAAQPFYTAQDVASDADLVGTWQSDEDVAFTFTPGDNNIYNVILDENESDQHLTSRFEGHLFRLGGDSFLDLYPASVPEGSEFYFLHFFRCHTVLKVAFVSDRLELRLLDATWLAKQIKAGTVTIAHAKSGDILLLTAPTPEMQDLLFLHASDEEAFADALLLERAQDKEAQ